MKKNNLVVKIIIFLLCIITTVLTSNLFYNREPYVKKYSFSKKYNEDKTLNVTLNLKTYNSNPIYCKFVTKEKTSDFIEAKNKKCTYNITTDSYKIILKYNKNMEVVYKKDFNIDKVISVKINNTTKYLAVGDSFNIDAKVDYVGDVDTKLTYTSSNPDVVAIDENGNVTALKDGESEIKVLTSNKLTDKFKIISTGLIRKRVLDNNKDTVPCNAYSKEQVQLLDDILAYEVEQAGPGTRAGVAVAARFLTLQFPYKVPYFYENGRLSENGNHFTVDGEGRWYHKGLYLGHDKELTVTQTLNGPSSWGCPLVNWEDDGYRIPGQLYPNGLDCSGYISWVLYNGGLDPGDLGSGISGSLPDLSDLGELRYNSYDLLHSGLVKTGDLIGWDGHVALIAGMTDTKIYITESLLPGVILDEYDYSSPYSRFYSRYDHIIDMSSQYSGDGNMPSMW